jgi:hypothetical protein
MSEPVAIENLTILSNGYNISVFYQIRKNFYYQSMSYQTLLLY